jgi:hypothetical protein
LCADSFEARVRPVRSRGRYAGKQTNSGRFDVPVWAWIIIILLVIVLLGGFGYSRR